LKGKKRKYILGGNGIFKAEMDQENIFVIEKEITQCEVLSEQRKITGGLLGFLG
jgi:hypothetical protein